MGRSEARDLIEHYENQPSKYQKKGRCPGQKRWGIEEWSDWFQKWMRRRWYASPKARDDALDNLRRGTKRRNFDGSLCRTTARYRKVDR